ncbi:MAG TPA: hypothetical protein DCP02_03400 [Actinobacteria bacterium]|nr:hypothetical protein [Actinomycetota bacterium]
MKKTDFINNIVLGCIRRDLIRMKDSIRPDSSKKGNNNYSLALCVISYMEYLGGFLLGADKKFKENVGKYISTCFKYPEEYPIKILREFFRNGLACEYFLQGGAISRNGKRPGIYKDREFNIVLDAETLANDFINSLEVFVNKLKTFKYEKRMETALSEINEFENKYDDFINKLENQT